MDDPAADIERPGTAADRKTNTSNATAYGAAIGLTIGAADWLILQCFAGGQWHWVAPSTNLIEVAAPIILLPCGVWMGKVISILGDIIIRKLQRADEP